MKYLSRYGLWLVAALVVFLLIYAVITVVNYRPPSEFTMATGREGGAYYKFGQEYQRLLAEKGYTLNLVPTAGSKENLELLEQDKVDVALVQTGLATAEQKENRNTRRWFRKEMSTR